MSAMFAALGFSSTDSAAEKVARRVPRNATDTPVATTTEGPAAALSLAEATDTSCNNRIELLEALEALEPLEPLEPLEALEPLRLHRTALLRWNLSDSARRMLSSGASPGGHRRWGQQTGGASAGRPLFRAASVQGSLCGLEGRCSLERP